MKKFRKIWKKFFNAVFGFPPIQWFIACVVAMFIWLLYITCRKQIVNKEILKKYKKKPAIFVFWHGRTLLLSPIVYICGIRGYIITSTHRDGKLMARIQRLFGLRAIYGSTTRGGVNVLRAGVRMLSGGRYSICISPDGPSGPSMRFHDGALYFAKMTGVPIIPVSISASRAKMRDTWDRYLIPMPFSRVICHIGTPVFIDRRVSDTEFKKIRTDLENYMVEQLHKMDAEFNLPYVEQDWGAGNYKKMKRAQRKTNQGGKK